MQFLGRAFDGTDAEEAEALLSTALEKVREARDRRPRD